MKWHDFEKLFDPDEHKKKPHHKHHAHSIRFKFTYKGFTFSGDNMTFTMLPGMSVLVTGFPVQADGTTISKATLSAVATVSSDPAVFTVTDDPTKPGQATLVAIGAGTATMTQTAIATEPDGTTTEKISGAVTIVIATPPPAPAAAIAFTFGTPFPTVPNPPIPPVVP